MMYYINMNCQKCGVASEYNDDLHCRKIFISEINDLIVSNEVE